MERSWQTYAFRGAFFGFILGGICCNEYYLYIDKVDAYTPGHVEVTEGGDAVVAGDLRVSGGDLAGVTLDYNVVVDFVDCDKPGCLVWRHQPPQPPPLATQDWIDQRIREYCDRLTIGCVPDCIYWGGPSHQYHRERGG